MTALGYYHTRSSVQVRQIHLTNGLYGRRVRGPALRHVIVVEMPPVEELLSQKNGLVGERPLATIDVKFVDTGLTTTHLEMDL